MEHLPEIEIKSIEHKNQRYNTPDDYYKEGQKRIIKISKLNEGDYEFLMLIHGLIEWYLTERKGIAEEKIAQFDKEHSELDDPGSSEEAPYHGEHMFAEEIEKIVSKELGVDWKKYCENFTEIVAEGRKNGI